MAASRMNSFSVCDTSTDRFEDGEVATQPKHQECHANAVSNCIACAHSDDDSLSKINGQGDFRVSRDVPFPVLVTHKKQKSICTLRLLWLFPSRVSFCK